MVKTQTMTLEQALKISAQQMDAGNYRAAELALFDILQAVPDYFDALHMLGVTKYYLSDLTGAIDVLSKAVKLQDVTVECWCNLGSFLAQGGYYDRACTAFDQAICLNPDYPDSYWNKSNTLCLDGQYDAAEKIGRKSVELAPERSEAWLNLGAALVKLDMLDEAVQCWEKSLELRPDFALAWNNLGNVLRDLAQPAEAEKKCLQALHYEPENVQAMNNLGNALFDMGRLQDAEASYRKAVSLQPDYAEAHNNLSVCLIYQQRFDDAVVEARYATLFQEGYAEAYMNLCWALRALGEFNKAEEAVQQAVLLYPSSARIKIELADMLLMQDRLLDAELILDEIDVKSLKTPEACLRFSSVLERAGKTIKALETIDKAIDLNPQMPESYIRKGQICHISGDIEKAEESYNKAKNLYADNPLLYILMADLYQSKGDVEAVLSCAQKAKELSPDLPGVYAVISKIKTFVRDDKDFLKMLELEINVEKRGIDGAASLYFALFSAYEDIHDYEQAFLYLKRANDCKRKMVPHRLEQQETAFVQVKKDYTNKMFYEFRSLGEQSELPVFILGMPRSGTTLTEQILAAHPNVYAAGEVLDFGLCEQAYGTKITKDNCADIGKAYVQAMKKRDSSGQALRIIDKMPGNFMRLGQIVSALPNARIIHCRRNPLDTGLSCYKQNFARGQYWSYSLESIAEQYRLYEDLMAYWRSIFPEKFLDIDYEETANNFEMQAKKIVDYVGLDWHEECLQPHKYKRTVLTASKMQVIKPVYNTSIASWKRYEEQLIPLMEGLRS